MSLTGMTKVAGLALTVLTLVTACATTNPYKSANSESSYGYYDTMLDENRYRVQFRQRGDNIGKAQDYALLRASDLTLQRGYDWFQIVDRTTTVDNDDGGIYETAVIADRTVTTDCGLLGCRTTVVPSYTMGAGVGTYSDDDDTIVVVEILLGYDPKPPSPNAYDAAQLGASIRSRRS